MPKFDLVLVHAPSVYDFRSRNNLAGPVADLIPSTPIFEMYPIGFTTIASAAAKSGYRIRIQNIATHMLADRSFDVDRCISGIESAVFGIDLHWLPHAHGALEIARLIKSHHPNSKVVIGGFSATYFFEEILRNHAYVDAVFLGDSAELPVIRYLDALESRSPLERVPNLAHRENGRICDNGITHIVEDLDDVDFDYGLIVKSAMRTLDLKGHLPYLDWKRNPMLLVSTVRGCTHSCVTCMGSCGSFSRNFGRERPAFRSPERLLEDMRQIESYFRGTIFLLGDIQQMGRRNAERLLADIRTERVKNDIAFEFFTPPGEAIMREIGRSTDSFNAQLSPDSHDPTIRELQGRGYSNDALERGVSNILTAGAERTDLFFMIGLPGQDTESVMATVEYADALMGRTESEGRLLPFISPLAPFIDPGSDAFNNPERMGYRILARGLEEHRELLLNPSWKHVLNYETNWMTREQIVAATYSAGLALNEAKLRARAVSEESARSVGERIGAAMQFMRRIDEALVAADPESALADLRDDMIAYSESTVCNKRELDWSSRSFYWSVPRAVLSLALGR